MGITSQKVSTDVNPWRFFTLALGISWFFWGWVILLGWNVWTFPSMLLGGLGLFGPALAEIILILRTGSEELRRDYWQRVFDLRRIGKKWHLVIWLTFPVINAVAILLGVLSGSPLPEFETAKGLLAEPWRIFPFAVFILFFGPVPEELGWRGYALDGLQARYNALVSSLVLGVVWALWHVPLFFMHGTFQHEQLGFNTPNFWSYMCGTVLISVLFTWIYNNTHRSTLSAILFHFMVNFSGELMSLTRQARMYSTVLVSVLAIVIVVYWGPETLVRQRSEEGI